MRVVKQHGYVDETVKRVKNLIRTHWVRIGKVKRRKPKENWDMPILCTISSVYDRVLILAHTAVLWEAAKLKLRTMRQIKPKR